jgi:hypothetical protein
LQTSQRSRTSTYGKSTSRRTRIAQREQIRNGNQAVISLRGSRTNAPAARRPSASDPPPEWAATGRFGRFHSLPETAPKPLPQRRFSLCLLL